MLGFSNDCYIAYTIDGEFVDDECEIIGFSEFEKYIMKLGAKETDDILISICW